MSKHKNYLIYGLNNSISLIESEKFHINSIIIAKDSIADNNKVLINSINKNNLSITYFNQKTFLNSPLWTL